MAAAPLAVAIAVSGGLLALIPLLAIVVPILMIGITPGVEALEHLRVRLSTGRRRGAAGSARPLSPDGDRAPVSRVGRPLADRGPPLPV